MRAGERRQAILDYLRHSSRPVSAGFLAERFSVSRQAVVGDVALLRAAGADISATPRGGWSAVNTLKWPAAVPRLA